MAKSKNLLKPGTRKKKPVVRKQRSKAQDPDWSTALDMSGQAYHRHKMVSVDWYYQERKPIELFPDLLAWMKENQYSKEDIATMKRHGHNGMVYACIYARCLRQGMPDVHPEHNTHWQTLAGTAGDVHPTSMYIKKSIVEAIDRTAPAPKLVVDNTKPVALRKSIQENMRDKTMEIEGGVHELVDQFMLNDCKDADTYSLMKLLRDEGCPPQTIDIIANPLKAQLIEINELMNPPSKKEQAKMSEQELDMVAQLEEGYSHLGKLQIRALQKFLERAVADCASYVQVKKADRQPRPTKQKTPAQLTRKFKYHRKFEELGLTSLSPEKMVNGTEAWLYNTKTRKLIYVIADEVIQTYSIKSNSVIGFDPNKSVQKTLRKPAEQIKELMNGGKPNNRKQFASIKSTEIKYNGRGNEHVVILKAW
tara:strand:+ start:1281 stop:2543 length:1263 start_codon:yes stop_codon:yes gene_type:complete